jgi:branched-chain amino acid transport system ATP-binding protein
VSTFGREPPGSPDPSPPSRAGDRRVSPLLEVRDLAAGYDDAVILHGVSIDADARQLVSIVGPNGAGKSTLLKAIYGLVSPRGGSIRLAGVDVTGERSDRLTRRGMNFVPQNANVFPTLTIAENLHVSSLVLPRAERRAALDDVLDLFPLLAARRRQRAGSLSGGERKLVALARALVGRPRLLLLDEPSAGLSPIAIDLVFEKLLEIRALGIAMVMVEQNARRALALSDTGYVLDLGRNAYSGPGPALLEDSRIVDLYLGGSGRIASSSTSTSTPSGMNPATK